jgi:HlyD family secretion protein
MYTTALKSAYAKLTAYAFAHKVISTVVLIILLGGGWLTYGHLTATSAQTRYVLGTAQMGTIVSTVSGSGQVAAVGEVEVPSKTSGDLLSVNVQSGQEVKAGAVLAQVDASDALYDLETAKISYDKLVTVDPADLQDAKDAAASAYANARGSLSKASSDMHDVLDGIDALFSGYLNSSKTPGISQTGRGYISTAQKSYYTAAGLVKQYDMSLASISTASSQADIESALSQAYDAATSAAQAAKYAQDAVVYVRSHQDGGDTATSDSAYSSVTGLVSTATGAVSSLSSAKSSAIESRQALADLQAGPDTLDLRSQQLSLQQKQQAVADATVRAPFDGIVSKVDVTKGETVGSGTAIATLITKSQIAELSLNEVDAAKVAVGNNVTLTFDAIEGLTLTGKVAQIDAAGTVAQGVVSYAVQIAFDSQDSRIKSGMTVNANIQTAAHTDALIVPSSAVKTANGASYVQVFDPPLADLGGTAGVTSSAPPRSIEVTTGISDDTNVEILSGLKEGQQVVVRTISGTAPAARTTAAPAGAARGGALRIGGGFGG